MTQTHTTTNKQFQVLTSVTKHHELFLRGLTLFFTRKSISLLYFLPQGTFSSISCFRQRALLSFQSPKQRFQKFMLGRVLGMGDSVAGKISPLCPQGLTLRSNHHWVGAAGALRVDHHVDGHHGDGLFPHLPTQLSPAASELSPEKSAVMPLPSSTQQFFIIDRKCTALTHHDVQSSMSGRSPKHILSHPHNIPASCHQPATFLLPYPLGDSYSRCRPQPLGDLSLEDFLLHPLRNSGLFT